MKKLLLALTMLLAQTLMAKQTMLQLDTKSHTALINDIIVTKSGDIVSASDDKTMRVWSSKTGKERRKILGQIGAGSEGKIYAIALSPNEEFLAVGGYLTGTRESGERYAIRIYNYKSGRLTSILKSHSNVVNDLAFSRDGKYLISASHDKTSKIWSVEDWRLLDTIKSHTNHVYAVKIIKKQGSYFAITAGYDNQISLYDMQKKKSVKSHHLAYKLAYLGTSKKYIAACGKGREIKIYDYNLKLIRTIKSETVPKGLAYSPNGDFLIAGSSSDFNYELINIYSVKKHYQKIQSFKKHTNLTQAVVFLDNQTAVSGGGDNNEIYIWNIKSGRVLKKIKGAGDTVWSVGIRGDTIGWGNRWTANYGKTKLQKTINLKNFKISKHASNLKKIATQNGRYSLIHRKGGAYGKSDAVLEIQEDGKKVASIIRGSTNGYRHNCYGFYKNYIVSGGMNGALKIYNLDGIEVANLVGHIGEVWSIALDGDRLVSGSDDQTIRVWDLSRLKARIEEIKIQPASWFGKSWIDWIAKNHPDIDINKKEDREELYRRLVKAKDSYAGKLRVIPNIYPMLSLFISKTNEWIAWTNKGYYNASRNGADYIGFHINQGADKEAKFLTVESMKDKYYKPDLIRKLLDR